MYVSSTSSLANSTVCDCTTLMTASLEDFSESLGCSCTAVWIIYIYIKKRKTSAGGLNVWTARIAFLLAEDASRPHSRTELLCMPGSLRLSEPIWLKGLVLHANNLVDLNVNLHGAHGVQTSGWEKLQPRRRERRGKSVLITLCDFEMRVSRV